MMPTWVYLIKVVDLYFQLLLSCDFVQYSSYPAINGFSGFDCRNEKWFNDKLLIAKDKYLNLCLV